MTRATVLQEVRQMRFEELYARRQGRDLTMTEAAEMLGVTERTFRRWSDRYEAEGPAGLQDRRLGKASACAVPVDEALAMLTLYETRYTGWTVTHFHERWQAEHGGRRSYTWTKNTLQDRLPKELALAGITDMAAANQFLRDRFVPAYNQRFAVAAAEAGSAFVPWSGSNLAEILCVQEERVVANDNTVRYQGRSLQIPQDRHRYHYVKVTVRVHAYPDGTLAVLHGPRCLARYTAEGQLIEPKTESAHRKDRSPRSRARPIVAPGTSVCVK